MPEIEIYIPSLPSNQSAWHPNTDKSLYHQSDVNTGAYSLGSNVEKQGPNYDDDDERVITNFLNSESIKHKFKFPGDIGIAKMHAKTKHFGLPTGGQCPCCG